MQPAYLRGDRCGMRLAQDTFLVSFYSMRHWKWPDVTNSSQRVCVGVETDNEGVERWGMVVVSAWGDWTTG